MGSTALTATIHGNPRAIPRKDKDAKGKDDPHKPPNGMRLVVSNLGDSRGILCRGGKALAMSEDHHPGRPDERARCERAGGQIIDVRGSLRVVTTVNPNSRSKQERRNYQGLAMTRSFGDCHFKTGAEKVVSSTPEVGLYVLCMAMGYIRS